MDTSYFAKQLVFIGNFLSTDTRADIKAYIGNIKSKHIAATTVASGHYAQKKVEDALAKNGFKPFAYGGRQPGHRPGAIQLWLLSRKGRWPGVEEFDFPDSETYDTFCCGVNYVDVTCDKPKYADDYFGLTKPDKYPIINILTGKPKLTNCRLRARPFADGFYVIGRAGRAPKNIIY